MWRIGNSRTVQALGADCRSRQLLNIQRKHQTTPESMERRTHDTHDYL